MSGFATVQLLMAVGRYAETGQRLERRWPGTSACSNGFDDVLWTMAAALARLDGGRRSTPPPDAKPGPRTAPT